MTIQTLHTRHLILISVIAPAHIDHLIILTILFHQILQTILLQVQLLIHQIIISRLHHFIIIQTVAIAF